MPFAPPLAFFGWWQDLVLSQQIFYAIALLAAFVITLMGLAAVIGFGDHDLDADDGSSLFSAKPVTGFFFGFGWAGGAAIGQGLSLTPAIAVAGLAGAVAMAVIAGILKASLRLRSSGNLRKELAVGRIGTVYVTVPPASAGSGQVTVSLDGRTVTFGAVQRGERPISSNTKVRVVELIGTDTVRIEPIS